MRVTLLGAGTTGDVLPLAILGGALQRRGHQVSVAAYANFAPLLADYGLRHRVVPGESRRIQVKHLQPRLPKLQEFMFHLADAFLAASRDAEAVLFATPAAFGASIAEHLHIPSLHIACAPLTPTGAFAHFACPMKLPAAWLNRITHRVYPALATRRYRRPFNAWRRERLNLAALPHGQLFHRRDRPDQPTLYYFSRTALARPADWPDHAVIGGPLQPELPGDYAPPAALAAFLQAGPKPLYVGFGSMVSPDAARTLDLVTGALDMLGTRAVLQRGWAELAPCRARANLFVIGETPHAWLFPRMDCIVHHGGNGTTGAALAAGIPQVIVPHAADQPFWGRRMAELGVAPRPLAVSGLTAARLAERIRAALGDGAMRRRAAELGCREAQDRRFDETVDYIEAALNPARFLATC